MVLTQRIIKILLILTVIGAPWSLWLFLNWPSRAQTGVPLYFDFTKEHPAYVANITTSYGYYDLDIEMKVPTVVDHTKVFMVEVLIKNHNNAQLFHSQRPAMLKHKSLVTRVIRDVLFCLLDIFQLTAESRTEHFLLGKN
jgi:hypothetical protein